MCMRVCVCACVRVCVRARAGAAAGVPADREGHEDVRVAEAHGQLVQFAHDLKRDWRKTEWGVAPGYQVANDPATWLPICEGYCPWTRKVF